MKDNMGRRTRKGPKRVRLNSEHDESLEPSEQPKQAEEHEQDEQSEHVTDERETILRVEHLEKAYAIPGGQLQVLA